MYNELVAFIRQLFDTEEFIPLHEPRFWGNEKKYVNDAIESTFVSSIGRYVDKFEEDFANILGVERAVACVNGTAALHASLILADVKRDDEVITQPLTFIATCNAISYQGAYPVFVDVERDTLGLSPSALQEFLSINTMVKNGICVNKTTGRKIKAVVPMHTFGHPCRIDEIAEICRDWNITLIEDAAECLGSTYKGKPLGTFGDIAAFSFNGNKIMTTGGGGVIIARNPEITERAKHITTTAKIPHPYEFTHDEIGYNYRMPNLNAALGCAQLEQLEFFLKSKRELADKYRAYFDKKIEVFIDEIQDAKSNFWLNAIILKDRNERDKLLEYVNSKGIMARPIWTLMNKLPMFKNCQTGDLSNSLFLEDRVVNMPSSVRF